MALPSTGAISLSQVNTELGKASTAVITLGDSNVRALAGIPTGPISMADLRGKTAAEDLTLNNVTINSLGLYCATIAGTLGGVSGSRILVYESDYCYRMEMKGSLPIKTYSVTNLNNNITETVTMEGSRTLKWAYTSKMFDGIAAGSTVRLRFS